MSDNNLSRRSFLQVLGLGLAAALVPKKVLEKAATLAPPAAAEPLEAVEPTSFATCDWSNCANANPLADFRALREMMLKQPMYRQPDIIYVSRDTYSLYLELAESERSAIRRFFGTIKLFRS